MMSGIIFRFLHTSVNLNMNKYTARLKRKAQLSWISFERKKGRSLVMANIEPQAMLSLVDSSNSNVIHDKENAHLSLKAPQRIAFTLKNLIRSNVDVILDQTCLSNQIEIVDFNLNKGLSEIKILWKPLKNVTTADSMEFDCHLTTLSNALSADLIKSKLVSENPRFIFKKVVSQPNKVDRMLNGDGETSPSNLFQRSHLLDNLLTKSEKKAQSLRNLINRDIGAIEGVDRCVSTELHTFEIDSKPRNTKDNVYNLDRDKIMSKVLRKPYK